MGDYPVVELNVRGSLLKFTDLKRSSSPIGDVQAFALAGRREEHLVVRFPTDRLGKARFQIDGDHPGVEVEGQENVVPVARRDLDANRADLVVALLVLPTLLPVLVDEDEPGLQLEKAKPRHLRRWYPDSLV